MTLQALAERLGCRLEGDGTLEVVRVAGLDAAGPGDVTFLANARYAAALSGTRATAVIAAEGVDVPCAALRTGNPYLAFAQATQLLAPPWRPPAGVHPTAAVAPDAVLGPEVSVGAFAVIGAGVRVGARTVLMPHVVIGADAEIGDDCVLHARVSIRERCRLGHRVVVQDGAVIGSDGFGFAHHPDGRHEKILQTAPVVVEDDVEIGANTTIDRPAVGETRIRAGAKIDNLVQIAHGVVVGRHTLLAAQTGVAGSTRIGDSVMLGGQVGVAGHLEIGDGTRASAKTGIHHSLPPGAFVSGYPSLDNREWLRTWALVRRLPDLRQRVADLERRLAGSRPTTPDDAD